MGEKLPSKSFLRKSEVPLMVVGSAETVLLME